MGFGKSRVGKAVSEPFVDFIVQQFTLLSGLGFVSVRPWGSLSDLLTKLFEELIPIQFFNFVGEIFFNSIKFDH